MQSNKFALQFTITPNKSKGTFSGDIGIYPNYKCKTLCGMCEFVIEQDRLYITSITVREKYQRRGYGTIMMEVIKTYANLKKLPVTVFAAAKSEKVPQRDLRKFYRKCGMIPFTCCKDSRVRFVYTLSKPTCDDFFWIPKSLEKRKRIKIMF